jgi:hypothetical protein
MKEKKGWDNIPSLQGLEVDWQYEPENPLGKRAWLRIASTDLQDILGVKTVPVKVVSQGREETGYLMDIAQGGMAVLLSSKLNEGKLIKVGLILGKHKLICRAVTRYVRDVGSKFGTGMEFVDLAEESQSYIAGIVSSRVFQKPL